MRRLLAGALVAPAILLGACGREPRVIRLATTTSVDNSGLLDVLLPVFRERTGIRVDAISVGSGKALQLARRGDADATLTHDPEIERVFLAEDRASLYRKIMFDEFLIVGPEGDPAGVAGSPGAVEAMRRIARSSAPFISRGDSSGTEAREKLFWTRAGIRPPPSRLLETGQAMAPTLRVASQQHAYCLTDRPTFLQLEGELSLRRLYGADPELLNTYAIMVVRRPGSAEEAMATQFAEWLADGEGRALIAGFKVKGVDVYTVWPVGVPRDTPAAVPRQVP